MVLFFLDQKIIWRHCNLLNFQFIFLETFFQFFFTENYIFGSYFSTFAKILFQFRFTRKISDFSHIQLRKTSICKLNLEILKMIRGVTVFEEFISGAKTTFEQFFSRKYQKNLRKNFLH